MQFTEAQLRFLLEKERPLNCSGKDLSGAKLGEVDLSNANLSQANLRGVDLIQADLSGADLTDADLSGADLTRVRFRGAKLLGADLRNSILTGADLTGVDLTGIRSADSPGGGLPDIQYQLHQANFTHATLTGPQRIAARKHYAILYDVTELDWLTCPYPEPLLVMKLVRLSARKQVLLATAANRAEFETYAREYGDEIGTLGLRTLEAAERFVDGKAELTEVQVLRKAAQDARDADPNRWDLFHNTQPDRLNCMVHILDIARGKSNLLDIREGMGEGHPFSLLGQGSHTDLVREVFGNPFRPALAIDSAWLAWNGGTVTALARGIYEDRAFERMPLLADALEDAGCADGDALGHLRGPGPHIRGCFVLDALLGKS